MYDPSQVDKDRGFIIEMDTSEKKVPILIEQLKVEDLNAIKTELMYFYRSIVFEEEPPVTISDGYKALKIAHEIMDVIQHNNEKFLSK